MPFLSSNLTFPLKNFFRFYSVCFGAPFLTFFLRFYLFMTDRKRERGRDTGRGRGREAGSMQEARRGTQSGVSRITHQASGGAKPLCHWGCPLGFFLNNRHPNRCEVISKVMALGCLSDLVVDVCLWLRV